MATRTIIFILLAASSLYAQSGVGELRLLIQDSTGLGVRASVEIRSDANEYHSVLNTDDAGNLAVKRVPYGIYEIRVRATGFSEIAETLEIASTLPIQHTFRLKPAAATFSVTVSSADTLIDPDRAGAVNQIGENTIQNRSTSLPGRSLQDLVNSQPGWLYEGNAVLHPRGSEYQTQFVFDGIPLTDDRSPGIGPEIEADDVDSMTIYTAGFPAEYGRKMGGVVEVNTRKSAEDGLHGESVLTGGSFDTGSAFAQLQYGWGRNSFAVSAGGGMTAHYLNPVVPQNFTNTGTTGDFSARYDRDFTPNDRFSISLRRELSRFEIPNEQIQESAGQLQNGNNFETIGTIGYSHIFSPDVIADLRAMVRDDPRSLTSNALSTPVIAFLHDSIREVYFKGSVSMHHGHQEWKIGVESDNTFLRENFSDVITNPAYFDPGTPTTFAFSETHPDLEQSAFVEDTIRLGNLTLAAGLRWDHYQLWVNQNAVSPRLSVARFFPSANVVVHASYDRIFQTPSSENILLSSSAAVESLNPNVLRLPVEPSHGNYYEAGLAKAILAHVKLDANIFRRQVNNYADDDQLLSTAVSFPIAFEKAILYGAEGKIEVPDFRGLSGFVSYSYIVGNAWFPVTGGLFLGEDAINARTELSGHFPDSQDQRNTVRVRFRYQVSPRFWIAAGEDYGSGLPFDFNGTYQQALAEYGPAVVDCVNFARGRVRPSLSVNASIGSELYRTERVTVRIQADGENLNNRLNVIDFGGLFSGNAIGPARSYFSRLAVNF